MIGQKFLLSGPAYEYGIEDYADVRVSSLATVIEEPAKYARKVLVIIDEIDGDRNVCAHVFRSKLKCNKKKDVLKNIFRNHSQDGSHWIFENEEQQKELIALFEHFNYKLSDKCKVYDPEYDSYSLWCDGIAIGKFNPDCVGVYAIRYEEYHPYYLELLDSLKK